MSGSQNTASLRVSNNFIPSAKPTDFEEPAEQARMRNIRSRKGAALEATQGQIDGFFSQLPNKCHLEEVASVGD